MDKRVVIMGATSGFGRGLVERFLEAGWCVGAVGRDRAALKELEEVAPRRVFSERIDILDPDASRQLDRLVERLGGMDLYFHSSGIAPMGDTLEPEAELRTAQTNVVGFTRMVEYAYRYFEHTGSRGRIVAISSIAGIRGLEALPAYSASKAYDSTLLEALRQRARRDRIRIKIVDIRPGWTRTPLLHDGKRYLMEMDAAKVTDMIFQAALSARRSVVIGWRWKILTFFERLVPGWLYERLHIPLWR